MVMDLHSRYIVGWSLDMSMTEQLITDALGMVYGRRNARKGLIVHSERDVHYRPIRYHNYLHSRGRVPILKYRLSVVFNKAVVKGLIKTMFLG